MTEQVTKYDPRDIARVADNCIHYRVVYQYQFFDFVDYLFQEKRDGNDGVMHAVVGLSGESGECLDLVKKSWVYGRPLSDEKLQEEAGDVLHYLVMLCLKMGWTLDDLMLNNMAKLRKRYPNGFSKAAAIARADQTGAGNGDIRGPAVVGDGLGTAAPEQA